MKEIVKYHNDLNMEIVFPQFMEQELNIFMHLLHHLKKQPREKIKFTASQVSDFFGSAYNNGNLGFMLKKMAERMTKQGFKWTYESYNEKLKQETIKTQYITMFPTFIVETKFNSNYPPEFPELISLEVRINPDFAYLLEKTNAYFTAFELSEYVMLSGKYVKNLYRLLKQFKTTGKVYFEWEKFKELMNVPPDYCMSDIDKRILIPSIKELSKERNLFDQKRIPFRDLAYAKIKGKGRGRGGKVIGIEFTFKLEKKTESPIESAVTTPAPNIDLINDRISNMANNSDLDKNIQLNEQKNKENFEKQKNELMEQDRKWRESYKYARFNLNGEAVQIVHLMRNDDKKLIMIYNKSEDSAKGTAQMIFDNTEHFENFIKKHGVGL